MNRDPQTDQALSDLANALQGALLLAERQVRVARNSTADAQSLFVAVERAVRALRDLRPNGGPR